MINDHSFIVIDSDYRECYREGKYNDLIFISDSEFDHAQSFNLTRILVNLFLKYRKDRWIATNNWNKSRWGKSVRRLIITDGCHIWNIHVYEGDSF